MRKTLLTATALAMSASLAGFAYAADSGGSTPTPEFSVVGTVPASTGTSTARFDDRGRTGADDPATHDVGDDHGQRGGGHGADDGANHDAGDDHGRHGADDGPNHDVGDDHGGRGGGHGSDD